MLLLLHEVRRTTVIDPERGCEDEVRGSPKNRPNQSDRRGGQAGNGIAYWAYNVIISRRFY